jgi:hypothetical protein
LERRSPCGERLSCHEYPKSITVVPRMKKMFLVSMLTSIAMICACQKQDSAAEQELAQRKTELDARENALDEKVNALDEKVNALDKKVKALFEKEQVTLNARTTATGVQGQTPDPAQVTAERDRTIQQLRALILDRSKVTTGDPAKQERPAPRQLGPEDLQRQWQQNLDKAKMSGKAVFPAAEAGSPTPSPAVEATSPSPSPTPE